MSDTAPATAGGHLPRLLFFRAVRDAVPAFLASHVVEQRRCLAQFFDVVEVPPDGDYYELCERYQPDLVLFESGVDSSRRRIQNTSAHPQIPKLGFLHADAVDAARAAFISDMAEWGIETYFTHSVAMGEYTPAIADRLYVWPNFIDPNVFRDYALDKTIPVLLTGSQAPLYPWRNAVSRVVSAHFPTMICPHFGWQDHARSRRMPMGESYARLLGAATFVPACGSVTRDLVRKHLEIPACGSCLVTERTATLESIGFRDMENCVFATPRDIVEKLDSLLAEPERLQRITRAGHDLVHRSHTMAKRRQIRDWLDCHRSLKPGEQIVQDDPTGPLRIARADRSRGNVHVVSCGWDRSLLRNGWALVDAGRGSEAAIFFQRCLNLAYMPEAVTGLAYSHLLMGNARAARDIIDGWLDVTFKHHESREPDPIAWATRIRIDLCAGKLQDAVARASQFPALRHLELDRLRRLLGMHSSEDRPPRPSIAPLPESDQGAWNRQLSLMLAACGQASVEAALKSRRLATPATVLDTDASSPPILARRHRFRIAVRTPFRRAQTILRSWKKRLEEDDWTIHVNRIVTGEPAARAVIIVPSRLSRGERAFRRSVKRSPWLPPLVAYHSGPVPECCPGDLVYVTAKARELPGLQTFVAAADTVLVEAAYTAGGQSLATQLGENAAFVLVLHDVGGNGTYAVFRRRTPRFAWDGMAYSALDTAEQISTSRPADDSLR